MGFLSRLRERGAPDEPDQPEPRPGADEDSLPISGYDRLKPGQITAQLHELSQAELTTIHEYESEHEDRQAVMAKLAYLRRSEPVPGYDAMEVDEVGRVLADSDSAQVKAVRDYERKFQQRSQVLDEAAEVLPDAPANAAETEAREAKAERVRTSMRRKKNNPPPA